MAILRGVNVRLYEEITNGQEAAPTAASQSVELVASQEAFKDAKETAASVSRDDDVDFEVIVCFSKSKDEVCSEMAVEVADCVVAARQGPEACLHVHELHQHIVVA